jgi:O-Antigen ligase
MISDALLALGLLLTTATELRLPGIPIGPGEILLVLWVVLMLFREVRPGSPLTPPLARLLTFWLLFSVALSVGTLAGYVIGDRHDSSLFFHDVMAYALAAVVSCLSVAGRNAGLRLRRVAWFLTGFGGVSLAFLVTLAWGWLDVALISPWYWDRFRGWSANPMQLALLCAVLMLLALYLADEATRTSERIAALACAILAGYVGRLTKSDSFSVVLVGAIVIFAALKLRQWLFAVEPKPTLRPMLAWMVILAVPLLLISLIPVRSMIAAQAEDAAKGIMKGEGKVSEQEAGLRFQIWKEGIGRGVESGMLGLGPGPHLQIPEALVAARRYENLPKFIVTPPSNGTANFEAHNTPVDLFTQGGLLAVLCFAWISATAFLQTYRARLAGLTTMLCGIMVFGVANLIVRQPLFWFGIALCLTSGTARWQSGNKAKIAVLGNGIHFGNA